MADEWRVSLVLGGRLGVPKKLVEDMRVRLGDDIGVSAVRARVFLYAGTAKAAEEAEQVAREVLTLAGQAAEPSVVERWDPVGQKWRDPRIDPLDDEDEPPPGPLRTGTARLVNGMIQILTEADLP